MKTYKVLKDIRVESEPPFIINKGSVVKLYKSKNKKNPVLGCIFFDADSDDVINGSNFHWYFEEVKE